MKRNIALKNLEMPAATQKNSVKLPPAPVPKETKAFSSIVFSCTVCNLAAHSHLKPG